MTTYRSGLLCLLLFCTLSLFAQQSLKLKVFIDCTSTWCDLTFIRSEINLIDFVLDRQAADVHVLYTRLPMGNGGGRHQLIFYGQGEFKSSQDTLAFEMPPLATDQEVREALTHMLKAGLIPYIAKTPMRAHMSLELKREATDTTEQVEETKDNWDYWVFRLGGYGSLDTDQNYFSSDLNLNVSVNRTTDKLKVSFQVSGGREQSVFRYEDENGVETSFRVENTSYDFNHTLVKSINDHWSYGYYLMYRNATFSNIKAAPRFIPAIEYNIFPYKEVNNKYLALAYGVDLLRNSYYEQTIYGKDTENLAGQILRMVASFNQKWGTLSGNITYSNYFHDWSLLSLEANIYADVRVTGNLSFWVATYGELSRNQVFIPVADASVEDVLARRRQLASSYSLGMWFGFNYRFGSMLNNFVNPRFTDEF